MVDLVKIRKKAKQKEEAAAGAAAAEKHASPAGAAPLTEPAAGPRPAKAAKGSAAKSDRVADAASEPLAPEPAAAPAAATPSASAPDRSALLARALEASVPGGSSKLDRFKEQAGRRREVASAQTEEETGEVQLELLTFVIAAEQYAVDIERIVEIVTPRPVTRIPNADRAVVGIISLRGTVVTLVDVRRKLRHREAGDEGIDTRIVVVDFEGEMVGFIVDRVLRVVKAAAGEIQPHPVVHTTELDESVRGVFRAGGALTILLDLDKLLDSRALAATRA